MKVGLITTINTNIGDDFIRQGICLLLKEIYKQKTLEIVCVNKHIPFSVYPPLHPIHLRKFFNRIPAGKNLLQYSTDSLFALMGLSCFHDCNLIVQCGAPVFWDGCSRSEWAKPLWHDVVGKLSEKIPVLNLAAGSCYPWERQQDVLKVSEDIEYIKSILGYCRLTTVRDLLAHKICSSLGWDTPQIPCTAFLAAKGRRTVAGKSGYVLINYMKGGGHYDWGQCIDPIEWETIVKRVIKRLKRRHHKLAFLCHDDKEYSLARALDSSLEVFYPKTPYEYFDCVAGAKLGICNRMHANIGMAGLGIPSIAVCTDTRLLMVAEIGLPTYYVKEVNEDDLEETVEHLLVDLKNENDRLLVLKEYVWNRYINDIQTVLS